jgi:methanogenic corrinoid protein MtbC1
VTKLAVLRERYLTAQLAGDRREAMRLVLDEGLSKGERIVDLQSKVIQSAQDELGRMWQQNRVTIAQEHMATAISELTLSALFEHAVPKASLGKKIVLACVEGEQHDLPARLVADLLDLEGFDVRFLGANVPHDDLVKTIVYERPDVIGLSVTMSFNVPQLRTAVERVRAVTDKPIFIGGYATRWSQNLAFDLYVESAGDTPEELIVVARRLAEVDP